MYELKIVRSVLKEGAPFKIVTARDAIDYVERNCQPKSEQWREMAWVLLLSGNKVTGHFLLSVGGTGSTTFDKKVVAKVAIESLADAIILVHNHPSGNVNPSSSDIMQTKGIRDALKLFDIGLLDHIIIGDDTFYSFATEEVAKI